MSYYRDAFPEESITPKLHMLEDHVCGFLKKWGASFGLYGKQGMESLFCCFLIESTNRLFSKLISCLLTRSILSFNFCNFTMVIVFLVENRNQNIFDSPLMPYILYSIKHFFYHIALSVNTFIIVK